MTAVEESGLMVNLRWRVVAVLAVALAFVSACSNDDGSVEGERSPAASSDVDATPEPALGADVGPTGDSFGGFVGNGEVGLGAITEKLAFDSGPLPILNAECPVGVGGEGAALTTPVSIAAPPNVVGGPLRYAALCGQLAFHTLDATILDVETSDQAVDLVADGAAVWAAADLATIARRVTDDSGLALVAVGAVASPEFDADDPGTFGWGVVASADPQAAGPVHNLHTMLRELTADLVPIPSAAGMAMDRALGLDAGTTDPAALPLWWADPTDTRRIFDAMVAHELIDTAPDIDVLIP